MNGVFPFANESEMRDISPVSHSQVIELFIRALTESASPATPINRLKAQQLFVANLMVSSQT